jgi:multidrug efflux pump subunit AcrB
MENNKNIYYHISSFFLKNKQLSLLLVITIFVFGFIAFYNTPKQYDPEITLPAFRIITDFPGASSNEVEKLVTCEIENKLVEIPGVDKLNSISFSGGRSVVTVTFKIGTDLDKSKTEVFEKINSNMDLAPLGVSTPVIQQIDPENVPIMTIAITSKEIDKNGLREFAYELRDKLKTVDGVTNLQINGGSKKQLNILLDNYKLAQRKISPLSVVSIVQGNNHKIENLYLEGQNSNIPLVIDGNIYTADDLKRLIIIPGNNPIYLQDVAEISESYDTKEKYVTLGESDAVYLSFAKVKGSNISTVTNNVKEKIKELDQSFIPSNINLKITRDEGLTANEEIMTLTEHLALAILIVTVTLYFFLGLRIAFVVATAIPLTLALVFICFFFIGYTFFELISVFSVQYSLRFIKHIGDLPSST